VGDLYARPVIATVEGQQFEVWPETGPLGAAHTPTMPARTSSNIPAPVVVVSQNDAQTIFAPIPGVIVSIAVEPGAQVEVGQELCVLEAMKMKNAIRSPRAGQIAAVQVSVGQHVKHHDVLIEYAG
jgi:glutaconyl-CoA/methylmalonyl-CoA decarboxylase subunit gamma